MKHYILKRRYFKQGTFSYLYREDGSEVCCMVERPDCNNIPYESCVVEGTYDLLPHTSPHHGECYALVAKELGVTIYGPSLRTHVLIHIANTPGELAGCLAPGGDFGYINGQWGVISSTDAFNPLMKELGGKPARLTIQKD
ncbi:MAG: hypothetical protein ACJAT7_002059 [Psychromonas sp.]|jgi:hypothetical protein|uniref:DUF5675 family protein n=1 Tax=Psychromonas sp. TaxID=1884585 RepID=UPI0039E6A2DB